MAKPKKTLGDFPPPGRRHSIAVGGQSMGMMGSKTDLRRSSITDSLNSLTSFLSKRRESRGSSASVELGEGSGVSKDFLQRVLASHYQDQSIKVSLSIKVSIYHPIISVSMYPSLQDYISRYYYSLSAPKGINFYESIKASLSFILDSAPPIPDTDTNTKL